jgi:hypothetical protein
MSTRPPTPEDIDKMKKIGKGIWPGMPPVKQPKP